MSKLHTLNFLFKSQTNQLVLNKWLHQLGALNLPLFNNSVGRFIKSQLALDLLEKNISEIGWERTDGLTVNSFSDAGIVNFSNSEEDYNLMIEGITLSFKGLESSILTNSVTLKKAMSSSFELGSYDYLFLYSPALVNKKGQIGFLTSELVKENCRKTNHSIILNPLKDASKFDVYLEFDLKYKLVSLSNEEYERDYKKFRNRICDTIDCL